MIKCQEKPERRDTSRMDVQRASRSRERARRTVTLPSISGWSSNGVRDGFMVRHELLDDDGRPLKLNFGRLPATYFARHDRAWNGALRIDPQPPPAPSRATTT